MLNLPSPGRRPTPTPDRGHSRCRTRCGVALLGLTAAALVGCRTASDRAEAPTASSFTMRPVFATGPLAAPVAAPVAAHGTAHVETSAAPCSATPSACGATPCGESAGGESACGQSACGEIAGIGSDLRGPRTPRAIFRDDREDFLPRLRDDGLGLLNWRNAALLAAAGGVAVGLRQDLDDEVRGAVAESPERWGHATEVLGHIGEAQYHIAALGAFYGYTVFADDPELHDYSTAMISAFTLTAVSTSVIKLAANTDRPSDEWNNGQYGFPSYHVSSLASIAAVTEEYHGLAAAAPLYVLTGLVGWSRIDERDHDLSDVAFGAALGWVIGKSVAASRLHGDGRVRLSPYYHPEGGSGLAFEVPF
jgi:hypothetical protein